jgi:ATP-dependent helicase/nuclease subunit B
LFRLPHDLSDILARSGTLIVPTRQRAHAVRLAHAATQLAAGAGVWASADVLAAGSWLRRETERFSGPRVLSAAEEWYLWRHSTVDLTADLPLLNAAMLGDCLQAASALACEYNIDIRAGAAGSEAQLLFRARQAFDERCRALGAASVDELLAGIQAADPHQNPPLCLCGFDAVPPRLASLVAARGAAAALVSRPAADTTSDLLVCADRREQSERIAAWCAERVRRQPDARLLVMLPGEPGARERLATLIRQALDARSILGTTSASQALVGIEGGQPLAEIPVIAHALTTLRFLAGGELDGARLSAWTRAPHWSSPSATDRARLDLKLRDRKFITARLQELSGALSLLKADLRSSARVFAGQLVRAAALLGAAGGSARVSPRTWSERFRASLEAAGWPGPLAADSPGQQTLMRWHELLEEFGALTGSTGAFGSEAALNLLEALAARSAFRPADADVTVTVSPMLADPVVRYDGVWVAELHADGFPQAVAPDPFLPISAQRTAGVPAASAEGRLAQARVLLAAWREASDELVLSAPRHAEDLELLPTPLLKASPAPARMEHSAWLPASLHREQRTELVADHTGVRWNVAAPLPRGTRTLDLQNTCPFKAYAELRLGSVDSAFAEPGIAAMDRGTLLHGALESLWGRLRDWQSLRALSDRALDELIAQSVREAALALVARAPGARRRRPVVPGQTDLFAAMPGTLARECRRAGRLIRKLCELDLGRSPFQVESTEHKAQLVLAGASVDMRIDRVDVLAAGGRAVLDYKTGTHTSAHWYDPRPTYPQLLAYLVALGEDVAALATVWVNPRALRFDGVAREAGLLPGVKAAPGLPGAASADAWRVRCDSWRGILERLVRAFIAGDAAVDPKAGACRNCHVINICRIAEREDADEAEAGADE